MVFKEVCRSLPLLNHADEFQHTVRRAFKLSTQFLKLRVEMKIEQKDAKCKGLKVRNPLYLDPSVSLPES
jgi:hypothetical protein